MRQKISLNPIIVFYIMVVQTVIAMLFLLYDPSEPGRAVLFGYSHSKLLLIIFVTFILATLVWIIIIINLRPERFLKTKECIKNICESSFGAICLYSSLISSILLFLMALVFIFIDFSGITRIGTIYFAFINAFPAIILWTVLNLEFFILIHQLWRFDLNLPDVSCRFSRFLRSKGFYIGWVFLIIFLSIAHWLILNSQNLIFSNIPWWYWQTTTKPNFRDWLIIPLVIIYLAGYWLMIKKSTSERYKTIIIILLGLILFIGFAAMEGSAYQVMYEKRFISGHRNYIANAARNTGGLDFLFNYEEVFSHDRFFATKPPGVYLLYRGIFYLGSLFFPTGTYEENYDAINHTIMTLFPILALLTIIITKKLTSKLSHIDPPHLSGYLLIIVPNFLLLQCTIDQAIIPLIFLSGLLLTIEVIEKKSWLYSLCLGGFIYLSLYFSFSLLPMVMIIALWIMFELVRNWKSTDFKKLLLLFGKILTGFLIVLLLFFLIFNYLPWKRYLSSIDTHAIQRIQPVNIKDYLNMYLLNNLEFALWIGFPLTITVILSAFSSFINFFWGKWSSVESMNIAFVITFLFLNHFGNTLSETSRLWLFFVPLITIFSINFLQIKVRKSSLTLLMLILQFFTAYNIVKHILITWE